MQIKPLVRGGSVFLIGGRAQWDKRLLLRGVVSDRILLQDPAEVFDMTVSDEAVHCLCCLMYCVNEIMADAARSM